MKPKEWSKFLRDLSDRENEKGEATITVCAALLDASKLIDRLDDSIDYLENSVSAHEENNVKICRENQALMRYFNSVENVLESDSHDDWSEYQAAKAAVMGLATVLLKPIPEGVVDPDACQHAAIEGGRCLNCDEMMAGALESESK